MSVSSATNLFTAAKKGCLQSAKTSLSSGSDPNQIDERGRTPLCVAVICDNIGIVEELLKADADPNIVDKDGCSPLWYACKSCSERFTACLLFFVMGSEIFKCDPNTRLGPSGREELVNALLKAGALPNCLNKRGDSPLHIATLSYEFHVAKLLLKAGSDCYQSNLDGRTPIDVAKQGEHDLLSGLLEKWPRVVSLRVLCLRVVYFSPNKPPVPAWVPPVLLRWSLKSELPLLERSEKRKREEKEEIDEENKKRK